MRTGDCDCAIVCGAHLTSLGSYALSFKQMNMLSMDGKCKSFDASGDGYVRSETIAAVFLQRKSEAKRIYATVLHTKMNADGFKEQGITFPSSAQQAELLRAVYSECCLDPAEVYRLN